MKHLPKHLQPRWRYLAVEFETWPDADFDRGDFQRQCWFAAQNLLGDVGSADLDLSVFRFDHDDGWGQSVIRVRRGETDRARAVLACIDEVNGDEIGLRVQGVSGTVRACEEKYIRRRPIASDQRNVVFENAERSGVVYDRGASDAPRGGRRVDVRCDDAFAGTTELDLE
ncbi:Rpp14/Pop5 family protein [Haloarculaceae archaeon H-GB2-1]|nr:Rpp14/Pop5 family protein [Haloarculaceae archaeon H-GB1-1]MEA5386528.1 Rpp14/Pop5 family protein [Haloarculaceae archaeon H-GB11]MEA5408041.1 Rpp14/Pop5 family protein [Haloarculaceae archaeon H-GB2-1]